MESQKGKIHFISIGGAVMHNLALCLQQLGWQVSGSDDEIFEPSKSRLAAKGLLPSVYGWFPERITSDLEAVILGMHARQDNPELLRAKELGVRIYSFPEYIYEQSKNKTRVVIGGSHGKTSTTAMVMHVLKTCGVDFDYLVGSQLSGFEFMVKISDAPIIVIEGDEYLNSALDPRPKFHFYKAHMAVLTGIAWDHINVFPTWENYVEQFRIFLRTLPDNAPFAYFEGDETLVQLAEEFPNLKRCPYTTWPSYIENGKTWLEWEGNPVSLEIFGAHNLQNLSAAWLMCSGLGIGKADFLRAISGFKGTARRLEKIFDQEGFTVFRDFAHSPSKLKATVKSVKEQFPERKLVAVFELHTFSSLNKKFLDEYNLTLSPADEALVYFNPEVLELKRMPALDPEEVAEAFGGEVKIYTDSEMLGEYLHGMDHKQSVLLLMSSGNFNNLVFEFGT